MCLNDQQVIPTPAFAASRNGGCIAPTGSDSSHEDQDNDDDQNHAENANAAMAELCLLFAKVMSNARIVLDFDQTNRAVAARPCRAAELARLLDIVGLHGPFL